MKLDEADRATQRLIVALQREPFDQPSMREVRKSPRAEDIDDYVEYKRLRELRQARMKDTYRRTPKHDKLLGIISALDDTEPASVQEDDEISVTSGSRRSAQLGETTPTSPPWHAWGVHQHPSITMASPDEYSPSTPSPYDGTMSVPSSFKPEPKFFRPSAPEPGTGSPDAYSPVSEDEPRPPTPGAQILPACSQPRAHSMPSRCTTSRSSMSRASTTPVSYDFPISQCEQIKSGCVDWAHEKAKAGRDKEQVSNKLGKRDVLRPASRFIRSNTLIHTDP